MRLLYSADNVDSIDNTDDIDDIKVNGHTVVAYADDIDIHDVANDDIANDYVLGIDEIYVYDDNDVAIDDVDNIDNIGNVATDKNQIGWWIELISCLLLWQVLRFESRPSQTHD